MIPVITTMCPDKLCWWEAADLRPISNQGTFTSCCGIHAASQTSTDRVFIADVAHCRLLALAIENCPKHLQVNAKQEGFAFSVTYVARPTTDAQILHHTT